MTLRTLLILGRVSNLPTVWSNCLAAWWLGGGGHHHHLPFLFVGITLLYIGGMFLNDAFDADFDQQYRKERPIPSGRISATAVWRYGFGFLLVGEALLFFCGTKTGMFGIALTLCILIYDALHKAVAFGPVIMGGCRFFVYLVAASTGVDGVTGWVMWGAVSLAAYIVGLSYIARRESSLGALQYWPTLFLAAPVILALLMNVGRAREPAALLCLIFVLWVMRCLRTLFWVSMPNIGRTVSGLLAGIVFVDWIAAVEAPREYGVAFILLFLSALLAQRYVPAT